MGRVLPTSLLRTALLAIPVAVVPANLPAEFEAGEYAAVYDDGPYSYLDDNRTAAITPEELRALLDLDGDPATLSPEEARMALLLMQVLFADPTAAPLDPPDGSVNPEAMAGL